MRRLFLFLALALGLLPFGCARQDRPANIVLVMADDMGWGETGYYNHPVLKTPNLNAMAASGLRFDRFYAGAPNCSPTRASVMTGRSNDRGGVENHGFALNHQERTLAQAMQAAGYATGHFGKWHLDGIRGAGVPILAGDDHNPGRFGFDVWLSVTNFFDRNPLMSRGGNFEEFEGDSSEIVVAEALKFIREQVESDKPFFTVIWCGSPHDPFVASEADMADFRDLDEPSRHHYGELVAMDRSIGTLRRGLRDLDIDGDTLVWFNSDNGGLPNVEPGTVGGLRGFKNSVYEGGLRVPAIIEWPNGIAARASAYPAATMDIFPTIAALVGLPEESMITPRDGIDLSPLFTAEMSRREKPLVFRHTGRAAIVDNNYKLLTQDLTTTDFELYDLEADPLETTNLRGQQPEVAARLKQELLDWSQSVDDSAAGLDYPSRSIDPNESQPRVWMEMQEYAPYFDELRKRPEYASRMQPAVP